MRIELANRIELVPRLCAFCGTRRGRCEWDGVYAVCVNVAGCLSRMAPREAAARAIVELDSIACGGCAPCVGPVERAITILLAVANPRRSEHWTAAAFVAECEKRRSADDR